MTSRLFHPFSASARHLARKLAIALGLSALLCTAWPATAQGGFPKSAVTQRWTRAASQASIALDDRIYSAFLSKYVGTGRVGINLVGYQRVSAADKALLDKYLGQMQALDVDRLTKAQQMAFWINLYNAATLDVVLDAWPVKSITRIDSPVLRSGPWGRKLVTIKGQKLSLNDIEHGILRPIWRDVRIHYAVNCASLGCPNLGKAPYRAETLNAQLETAARSFVNSPRAFANVEGKLVASKIYDWYGADWGGEAGVLNHARKYATGPTAVLLAKAGRIGDYRYDWSINVGR